STASELLQEPAPFLHTKLAELYVRSGELEKALQEVEKAKLQNPNDVNVLLLYAGILEALSRNVEAEPVYNTLIEKHPDSLDAHVLLSSLYIKKQRYEEAL